MIKIQVELFASLREYLPEGVNPHEWYVEAKEGEVLQDFILGLNIPMEKIKLIFINNLHATGNEVLKDKDRLGIFPAVAGG